MYPTAPLLRRFNEFELDEGNVRLTRNGHAVPLPPKAFAVLCALLRQPGQLLTKDQLLDTVWGHQHVSESVLKTVISELRAALADDPRQPRYIETVARRGYRFANVATSPAIHHPESLNPPAQVPSIVGRETALATLHAAWREAHAGRRQIFWIAGEAGIGKTTLIDRFVAESGATRYALGQCVEQIGVGEPYLPVLEALGMLCDQHLGLIPLLRAVAPRWMIQLPWLNTEAEREELRRELAGTSQDRMLRELGELLDRYTRQQPLLLITEDLHWSDHATIRLIDHIARRRGPARLMWLASFRLAEVIAADHPLKELRHELRLHKLCSEIMLDPFSEREIAAYLERSVPDYKVSEDFVRRLHAHTDGLPLFVVNVLDDLVAQGGLPAEAGTTSAHLQVPENLAGVIEKQIQRLTPDKRILLEAASVCGVEFRRDTLANVLERDSDWVGEQCEDLIRRQHWLRPVAVGRSPDGALDARYAFRHALYRHVFYQRLGALARAQLHGRAAVSMERSRAQGVEVAAAELAAHCEQAQQPATALRHYADATENALCRFAPTEAMTLTTHALSLLPQCPEGIERLELELALVAPRGVACSQLLGVASPQARAAFERAQAITDLLPPAPERAKELSGLCWVHYTRGDFEAALALARRMLTLAQNRGDGLLHALACNLIGATLTYQGDAPAGAHWMQQGLTLCDDLQEQLATVSLIVDPVASMHANLCIPLVYLGFADQARQHASRALARAEQIRQPIAQMLALWCWGILEARIGDATQLLQRARVLETQVVGHALAQGEGPGKWLHGLAQARLGEPDAGYELILQGYERHARFGMYCGGTQVLGYAVEALILGKRWSEAQTRIDEALALASRINERIFVPDLYLLQARIALGQGQPDAARSAIEDSLRTARAHQLLGQELSALVALCELDTATPDDLDALESAYGRLREGFDIPEVKRAQALLVKSQRSAQAAS